MASSPFLSKGQNRSIDPLESRKPRLYNALQKRVPEKRALFLRCLLVLGEKKSLKEAPGITVFQNGQYSVLYSVLYVNIPKTGTNNLAISGFGTKV